MNNVFVVVENPMGISTWSAMGINIKADANIVTDLMANIAVPHQKFSDNLLSLFVPRHMVDYFKGVLTRMGLRELDIKSQESQELYKEFGEILAKVASGLLGKLGL